jgi:hypothetical protein
MSLNITSDPLDIQLSNESLNCENSVTFWTGNASDQTVIRDLDVGRTDLFRIVVFENVGFQDLSQLLVELFLEIVVLQLLEELFAHIGEGLLPSRTSDFIGYVFLYLNNNLFFKNYFFELHRAFFEFF